MMERPKMMTGQELRVMIHQACSGETKAQFELGKVFMLGRDLSCDYIEAAVWLKMAANAGHDEAQQSFNELIHRFPEITEQMERRMQN
ncbi:MAG: hypothetical protein CSYNP_02830 [Syntrophus sp. SKADARSKE-3]|nr:hypothetical protein [Syntrophus sp. SKADARSKE-3]